MKNRFRKLLTPAAALGAIAIAVAIVAILAAPVARAAAPGYARAAGYTLTTGPSLDELVSNRIALQASIADELPAGVLANPVMVNLTADETKDLSDRELATAFRGPAVVGLTKSMNAHVRFTDLDSRLISTTPRRTSVGTAQLTSDGGFIWALAVRSQDASGMRLHLKNVDLPSAADLYWMNMSGEIYGPYQGRGYNGNGDFWTHTISGSEGVLVLRHYGPNGAAEMQHSQFVISDLGHVGPAFAGVLGASAETFCSYNASCVLNASCSTTDPPANPAKNAVARMQWISGPYIYTCTGGLIADTAQSGTRNFLTANHCLSTNSVASSLETYFQYSIPCGATCPGQLSPGGTRVAGASVQSTSTGGDYTLLLLSSNDALPSGTVFLGWNSSPIANTNGAALYRISHPAFAPQAYSRHSVDTSAPTCTGWPRGQRIYSRDQEGATEGGSSGSPVLNANSEIVGQLSGACGYNTGNACDAVSNATVDGAFAYYYSNISSILDNGGGGCTPTENPEVSCSDGIDNDCDGLTDSADPDCTPTCTPTENPEVSCSDGIDNDCDGLTDGADPDCQQMCSPVGATCSSNSDCCSNKCRGRRSTKTCR
ncbi:MAG TPA: trypsin-like peptidase domain-containing protein [Candidatus Polarisedimenticolia bacterium]|nr:trypsin-like peptidase domain-containing protein [Candidatus Polarisedimenticolia bacterium]